MKFAQFCQRLSDHAGRPSTFLIAIVLITMWGASGPWFHYNDTWQLIINTSTTIITFLMVFLIQNTQNRDNDIIHLKLDDSAKEFLIEKGYDPQYGARPMRRAVEKYLEDPMAEELLRGQIKPGTTIDVKRDGEKLAFVSPTSSAPEPSTASAS